MDKDIIYFLGSLSRDNTCGVCLPNKSSQTQSAVGREHQKLVDYISTNSVIQEFIKMSSNFTKRVTILATILALIFFMPGIVLAAPTQFDAINTTILATATTLDTELDLTPQERQELQAVRQRRNREILAVLDLSQRAQLAHNLRHGNNFNQALEKLNLQSEQEDLIKAIMQLTNLKLKAILSRRLLPVVHQ